MKRFLCWLIVLLAAASFAAMPASAASPLVKQGEALLQAEPPEYEKAAQSFRRAGLQGAGEGYSRLAKMYEDGLLTAGDPCIDDLAAIGKQKAAECYRLAEENGFAAPVPGWQSITQDKAKEMMAEDDGHVIVDVRRQDEYDAGHIPEAVLIPNESIGTEPPEGLPDFDQIILIYCRSGNRSKQAAQKLADMGFTNVYEFGGISTWDSGIKRMASAPADRPAGKETAADGTSNCA